MNRFRGPSCGNEGSKEESNIYLEVALTARNNRRDRGYFRVVREKRIGKRMGEARNAKMPVSQPGRYSKTSPFAKDLSHRIRKSPKGGRSISPGRKLMEAA